MLCCVDGVVLLCFQGDPVRSLPVLQGHAEWQLDGELHPGHHAAGVKHRTTFKVLSCCLFNVSVTIHRRHRSRHGSSSAGRCVAVVTWSSPTPCRLGPEEMEVLLQFMYGAIADLPPGASARYRPSPATARMAAILVLTASWVKGYGLRSL